MWRDVRLEREGTRSATARQAQKGLARVNIESKPGDVIYTPPGEWHWHGAAADHFMTHIAMWEVDEQGNSATWGEHVSDAEYRSKVEA